MTGPALAFADSGEDVVSGITIRITPPSGWAAQRAEVEVRITDTTGEGFQTACVKAGGGSWRDITAELEQTENRYYCVTEITENCTVYVRVAGMNGKTYEKSEYIRCFNTTSDNRDTSTAQPDPQSPAAKPADTPSPSVSQPPAGQGTVVDNVTAEDGREFFTIATRDDNTFYLVIDKQRNSENVYFLDTVKETDLLSLSEKEKVPSQSAVPDPEPVCTCVSKCVPGEVKADCPVCMLSYKDCIGKAPAADPDATLEPDQPKQDDSGTIILVALVVLAVGGAGYYLKIYKPKHDLDDAEDFDELTGEDEETVNEDEDEPALRRSPYAEPEEPDYPEGYGCEEPEGEE